MFEVFDKNKYQYTRGGESLSFQSCGRLGISKKLSKKLDLSNYSHAVLYYDKDSNKAAIALTKEKTKNSYKLTITRSGVTVRAAHFFDKLNIKVPQKNIQVEQIDQKENEIWLIFDPKIEVTQ